VSFWALAEIVKAQAGILESDSEDKVEAKLAAAVREVASDESGAEWMTARLRSLVGLAAEDESVAQSESFSAWRSFLEAVAEMGPLVLVFEDLHWADDGLLDFVDQLVEWARSAPILVLCTARPELLEPGPAGAEERRTPRRSRCRRSRMRTPHVTCSGGVLLRGARALVGGRPGAAVRRVPLRTCSDQ
jgi:hypothetical protein